MPRSIRRRALAAVVCVGVASTAAVALAAQWQATCVKCGHQSTHSIKGAGKCQRGVNGKNCGGTIVWVQIK